MANLKIGKLIQEQRKDGTKNTYLALGSTKNKDPRYNLSVEILVKDATGKVVAKQTNGFVNLSNPRTEPDELLRAGKITEEVAEKMKSYLPKLPEKIKYDVKMKA